MQKYIRIGVDIAKNSFQVHALDNEDCSATKRKLSRSGIVKFLAEVEPCAIGMEACGSAHYWARRFRAMGHEVKLTPPIYVKPYVKRGKNDTVDAAAICEAMSRPNMRFVAIKSEDQQATLMAHKTRELLIKQRTMSVNALRGHLAEFGVIAAKGIGHVEELVERAAGADLPAMVQATLGVLLAQLRSLDAAIDELERAIVADHRRDPVSRLAASVPGVGALAASAILASAPDPHAFKSGRDFAAWLGATPKQNSTGGKEKLGSITKQGQSLYPTASGVGRHLGLAGGAKAQGRVVRLAGCAQSAQTAQGRGRGVGQQARPDRLGDHHHRRGLPQLHLR